MPRTPLDDQSLDLLFRDARTHSKWVDGEVTDAMLQQIFDLMKMAPTSANCSPARFVFITSPEGKEKLKPALLSGNVEQTMAAQATAIIAYDMEFYEHLPKLYPPADAKSWFTGNDTLIYETAFRNGSLQGAYLMMAARSLGLDCGPMSGFDEDKLNAAFFPDGRFKANFLCNIGFGNDEKVYPRTPRFEFDEVCEVV